MTKRRADLTFRHNQKRGRYGWLRLTPAYSLKMVRRYLPDGREPGRVLDPFCGTGTTPLYAAYNGFEAEALELNPFLTWFASVKTATYREKTVEELREIGGDIISGLDDEPENRVPAPPISNINRWWSESALDFLRRVKGEIEAYRPEVSSDGVTDLLYVCFCRTLMKISNAAFNHQSVSFEEDKRQLTLFDESERFKAVFLKDVQFVADSAGVNPSVVPHIVQGDARHVGERIQSSSDLVITSPPYPNRMSYIRELRPYMYWLGYLEEAKEAGEMDWEAIGGTWGIATSRLSDWTRNEREGYYPPYFRDILKRISDGENKHGRKMANYVARYFEDILQHFQSLIEVLNSGATVHYVVGNSTFYDVLVPVERLYKEIMELAGFSEVDVEVVRKRNSKRELYEFVVSGRLI